MKVNINGVWKEEKSISQLKMYGNPTGGLSRISMPTGGSGISLSSIKSIISINDKLVLFCCKDGLISQITVVTLTEEHIKNQYISAIWLNTTVNTIHYILIKE